jgi:hypothetical protein
MAENRAKTLEIKTALCGKLIKVPVCRLIIEGLHGDHLVAAEHEMKYYTWETTKRKKGVGIDFTFQRRKCFVLQFGCNEDPLEQSAKRFDFI